MCAGDEFAKGGGKRWASDLQGWLRMAQVTDLQSGRGGLARGWAANWGLVVERTGRGLSRRSRRGLWESWGSAGVEAIVRRRLRAADVKYAQNGHKSVLFEHLHLAKAGESSM